MFENINMKSEITEAYNRIHPHIRYTPLIKANAISELLQANVYLKLENIQITHSFKLRGAFNKLLVMPQEIRERGVIAASSGNHGAAVSYACRQLGVTAKIFVPNTVPATKLEAIKLYGAEVLIYGDDAGITEQYAREQAAVQGVEYISPYNDIAVICGQGTIGYELYMQLPEMDEIYIAVGGGGLISGIASYLKAVNAKIKTVGCLPENSPAMYECIKAGKMVEVEITPTLSDGTAGNNDLDSITLDFCQRYVDAYQLTTEAEIKAAMRMLLAKEHLLVEGSVGVALAALLQNKNRVLNKNIVVVVCGGNISLNTLQKVICD